MRGLPPIVAYGLILIGVLGLLGLLASSARRGRPQVAPGRGLLVRQSPAFRLATILTALASPVLLILVLSIYPSLREDSVYVLAGFATVLALVLPFYWDAARYYVLATGHGLECRSPWRAARYFAWDDIREVSFGQMAGWFVFEAWDGDRIRVPATATGIKELLGMVESHVPGRLLKKARPGWERVGRPFPRSRNEPVLEARPPLPRNHQQIDPASFT